MKYVLSLFVLICSVVLLSSGTAIARNEDDSEKSMPSAENYVSVEEDSSENSDFLSTEMMADILNESETFDNLKQSYKGLMQALSVVSLINDEIDIDGLIDFASNQGFIFISSRSVRFEDNKVGSGAMLNFESGVSIEINSKMIDASKYEQDPDSIKGLLIDSATISIPFPEHTRIPIRIGIVIKSIV